MVPTLKWGQPFMQSALIFERGSSGLLFMLAKELRRTQNSSVKGCGKCSITLGENKQGRFPLIHGAHFFQPSLGGFGDGEASWYLPAVLSKVCLGKWQLPRSTTNYPSTPRRSHLLTHLPNRRNLDRLSQKQWEESKVSLKHSTPPLSPQHPALLL